MLVYGLLIFSYGIKILLKLNCLLRIPECNFRSSGELLVQDKEV